MRNGSDKKCEGHESSQESGDDISYSHNTNNVKSVLPFDTTGSKKYISRNYSITSASVKKKEKKLTYTRCTQQYRHNNKLSIEMENQFIPAAIELVSKAIEADNNGEFEKVRYQVSAY